MVSIWRRWLLRQYRLNANYSSAGVVFWKKKETNFLSHCGLTYVEYHTLTSHFQFTIITITTISITSSDIYTSIPPPPHFLSVWLAWQWHWRRSRPSDLRHRFAATYLSGCKRLSGSESVVFCVADVCLFFCVVVWIDIVELLCLFLLLT